MSIQESENRIKSPEERGVEESEEIIFEEDFDIVPKGSAQNSFGLKQALFYSLVLILMGTAGYGLGRLSKLEEPSMPVVITDGKGSQDKTQGSSSSDGNSQIDTKGEVQGVENGIVIGSKNGSKYHYPYCAGAQNILEENKITFSSIEEARAAGYLPAANCKGLK